MAVRNDPALMRAAAPAEPPAASPARARLAAEVASLDAAVARVTETLGFYEEPGQYAAAQRRLA